MNLQDPRALLLLLPLAGVLILLYLLRMRRRDVRVPASFLWPERTDEVRANALFQRLRFSWLLVLQLLALTAVVLALARPQTKQQGLAGEVTVFVIDASASMGATDVEGNRFEAAKRLVVDSIRSADAGDRIALIEAGPQPRVVFSLSSDPLRQLRAVESLERTDGESDVGEAMRLASALVGSYDGARIVLLSDGCFEPIQDFSKGKAAVTFQQVGRGGHNLAITALGLGEGPKGPQLFVGLRSFSLSAIDAVLTITADGAPVHSEKLSIAGRAEWGRTISVPRQVKVFQAQLEAPQDQLGADNYAVALADPGSTLRVLLVSAGNPFLERALVLDPRVTLDRAPRLSTHTSGYDIVVFDGVTEQPVDARGVLTFGAAGAPSPVTVQRRESKPQFVSAEPSPLMEGVDLRNVYIEASQRVAPKATSEAIAHGDKGPLVVADRSGRTTRIYVAFEPLRSDFPLQIGFPIFIANCLGFLGGREMGSSLRVSAGQAFSLSLEGPATLEHPDGRTETLTSVAGNVVVRSARAVGRYQLTAGSQTKTLFATLRSDRESDIMPNPEVALGGGQVRSQEAPVRFTDFWRPLVLLALLVLAGEWWLYARRS